jgi:CMP-N-acetylneuraminic acid synthetase
MGIEKYVGMLNITCPEPGWPQIIEALPALMKRNRIAAFTAYPFRGFIYSRKGPVLESHNRAWNQRPRSQDQQTYRESGAFYFFRADHVMLMPDQIIPQSQIIEVPETPEIDYPEDLERCRILSQK